MAGGSTLLMTVVVMVCVTHPIQSQRIPSTLSCDPPCSDGLECRHLARCQVCNETLLFCVPTDIVNILIERDGFNETFCGSQGVTGFGIVNRLIPYKCLAEGVCPDRSVCMTSPQDGERYCCANIVSEDASSTAKPTVAMTQSSSPLEENSSSSSPTMESTQQKSSTVPPTDPGQNSGRQEPSLTCVPSCSEAEECRMVRDCKECLPLYLKCVSKSLVDPVFQKNRFRDDFCAPSGVVLWVFGTELLPLKCTENGTCPDMAECKNSFIDNQGYCCAAPSTGPQGRRRRGVSGQSDDDAGNNVTSTTTPWPTFPPYVTDENQTFSLIIDIFTTLFPFTTTSTSRPVTVTDETGDNSGNLRSTRRKRSYWNDKETKANSKKVNTDCMLVSIDSTKEVWNSKILTPPVSKTLPQPKHSVISEAQVLKQNSKMKCTKGKTFFFMERILLVRGGCSAVFRVCFKPSDVRVKPHPKASYLLRELTTTAATSPPPIPPTTTSASLPTAPPAEPDYKIVCRTVVLRSSLNRAAAADIPANSGSITSMNLVRQLSGRRCVDGINFNFDGPIAMATRGCKGEFRVCQRKKITDTHLGESTTVATTSSKPPVPVTTKSPTKGCYKLGVKSTKDKPVMRKVIRDKNGNPATITSVTLLDEFSNRKCIEQDTYFYQETTLFVIGRCFGFFLVCFEERDTTVSPQPPTPKQRSTTKASALTTTQKPSCKIVHLKSTPKYPDVRIILDSEYRLANITSMTLILEKSYDLCELDTGYFVKGSSVIARNGCAGAFAVCFELPPDIGSGSTSTASTQGSQTSGTANATEVSTTESPESQNSTIASITTSGATAITTATPGTSDNNDTSAAPTDGVGTQASTINTTVITTKEVTSENTNPTTVDQTQTNSASVTPTVATQTIENTTNAATATPNVPQTTEATNITVTTSSSSAMQTSSNKNIGVQTTTGNQTNPTSAPPGPTQTNVVNITPTNTTQREGSVNTPTTTTPGVSRTPRVTSVTPTPTSSSETKTSAQATTRTQTGPTPTPSSQTQTNVFNITTTPGSTKAATTTPGSTKAATTTPVNTQAATTTPRSTKAATSTPGSTKAATTTPVNIQAATTTPGNTQAATTTPGSTKAATTTTGSTKAATTTPVNTQAATTTPGNTQAATTTPGSTKAATSTPGSTQAATTTPGSTKSATTTPGSTKAATTEPGNTEAATTPRSTKAATTAPGNTQAATTTPVSTKAATPTPGSTKAATTTPGNTQADTTTPGNTQAATTTPGSTKAATTTPGSTKSATTTPGSTKATTTTPGRTKAATTAPGNTSTSSTSPPGPPDYLTCKIIGLMSSSTTPDIVVVKDTADVLANIMYMELVAGAPVTEVCEKGKTFFFMGAVVVAKEGCSGAFEVCYLDSECQERELLSGAADDPAAYTIQGENGELVEIRSVTVITQIGALKCVEWQSFFYTGNRIIVRNGCHARFRICYAILPEI